MRSASTDWHEAGHQRMRLAMHAEVDFAPIVRRRQERFDVLDLHRHTVQGQAKDIVVPPVVGIQNDVCPPLSAEVIRNGVGDRDILGNGT